MINLSFILPFLVLISSSTFRVSASSRDSSDGEHAEPYRHIGCFNDRSTRAMVEKLGKWKAGVAISKCGDESWRKGYEVFGVQYSGECWSAKNASSTYAMYGNSSKCENGTGGGWANDVYSFLACQAGYFNSNSHNVCQRCPVDTYKENNVTCNNCSNPAKTWGRRGVAISAGCTVNNPLKVSSFHINVSPHVTPGTIIFTMNASYLNESLVIPPLVYTITSITTCLKVNARDDDDETLDNFNSCSELDNLSHPFCIFRQNGSISVNKNFSCTEGDRFVIKINVSDSANVSSGIISNSNGSVNVTCYDTCKDVRRWYEKAWDVCLKSNFSIFNNGSTQLRVDSSNIYEIYYIYLIKEKGKALKGNCSVDIRVKDLTYTISSLFNFNENQTVRALRLPRSISITRDFFNMSLLCNNSDQTNLSSITQVIFTVLPRRYTNCTAINKACLLSVASWIKSVKDVPSCKRDPSNLQQRYGDCIAKPKIYFGATPWRGTSGSQVRFYCNVTSPVPVKIEWRRENYASIVGTGQSLVLTAHANNQSYYWCKATNLFGTTKSRRTLLVVTDYFTSLVSFKLKTSYDDAKGISCSESCIRIAGLLGEYMTGPCRHWDWDSQFGVECAFYRTKKSQDINDYYQKLIAAIGQVNMDNLQRGTIVVRDAEHCLERSTGQSNFQGIFKWKSTRIGNQSQSRCPLGPGSQNALRKCVGDFRRGGAWKEPNVDHCKFKSQNTKALHDLSKTKVNPANAKQIANNLTTVFKKSSSQDLTEADANLAAKILQDIVSIGEKLNETAELVLDVIDTIMEMNETTLDASKDAATKIVKVLDQVAENVPIAEGQTSKVLTTGNLVLQANKVTKASFRGIGFGVKEDGSPTTTVDRSVMSVHLPRSVLDHSNQASSRVGFIHYGNNKLFQSQLQGDEINLSRQVLSSSVYNTTTSNLTKPVRLRISRLKGGQSLGNASCVYWNEEGRNWLRDGCTLCSDQDSNDDAVQCCCSHLTNFAVLFSPQPTVVTRNPTHVKVLSIITYVGCAISLVGVVLTFLTYSLFRHLRKTNQQPIVMNICVAIALLLIVFMAGVNGTNSRLGCQIAAVLLHYLTLVTVFWMGIEAYNLYLQIVKVMAIYKRKFMFKAAVVGWGVPLLIVLATLTAAIIQYKQTGGTTAFYYGNQEACILHNHLYRLVGWFSPILAILFINLIIFCVVVRKLHCTGAMVPVETKSNERKRCWTAFAILSLLGLTWLFGALAISDARIVFEYLFCIFNSLQGFFIFFFHCVRIKEVRNQWSFFVSGLGFSHKKSEHSQQRSRGVGESRNSPQAGRVRGKSWTPNDSGAPRKGTMLTTVEDKNGSVCDDLNKVNIELDNNVNNHTNHAMDEPC